MMLHKYSATCSCSGDGFGYIISCFNLVKAYRGLHLASVTDSILHRQQEPSSNWLVKRFPVRFMVNFPV